LRGDGTKYEAYQIGSNCQRLVIFGHGAEFYRADWRTDPSLQYVSTDRLETKKRASKSVLVQMDRDGGVAQLQSDFNSLAEASGNAIKTTEASDGSTVQQ